MRAVAMAEETPGRSSGTILGIGVRLTLVAALVLAFLGAYSERWGLNALRQSGATGAVRVGELAPPLSTQTLDGGLVSLEDYRGRVVVLNFWATWCAPCRIEMPEMQRYQVERGEQIAVLGVNMQEPPAAIRAFVQRYGLTFPILLDEQGAISATYRVVGLPSTAILDRNGVVREWVVGPMTRDVLARYVERLL